MSAGSKRRTRDERGVVAVVFGILAVLFFCVAAMGVDLGNAMDRKKENQNSADLAALAGSSNLPDHSDTTLQKVADFLNKNQPATDGTDKCDPSSGPVTAADLRDGMPANGEVSFPTTDSITVTAPATKVNFGLASVMGVQSTCVQSQATARLASGGLGMAPYYATSNCDSGIQTLKSNASGLSVPVTVPTLYADSDTNASTLSTISPNQIPLNSTLASVTITGKKLDAANVDQIGFFNSDRSAPTATTPIPLTQSATSLQVFVPVSVAAIQDVWYVRVHSPTTNKWSTRSEALSLVVGSAVLSCDPNSASGNFGSLDLPGWKGTSGINSTNDQLAMNIASGLKPPLSLTTYKGTPFPAGQCPAMGAGSVSVISDDTHLYPNTNCVNTSTGLDTGAASEGFLTGVGPVSNGKLRADTSPACTALGRPTRYHGNISGKDLNVNDDLLTCFFVDSSTTIAQAIAYNGTGSLFTQDIWKSPRFSLIPVFTADPPGSKTYPILKFVAGFICDQPTGATKANMFEDNTQTDHGLVVTWAGSNPKLGAIRMIFFPLEALPPPPDGGVLVDYFGTGKKVPTLIN